MIKHSSENVDMLVFPRAPLRGSQAHMLSRACALLDLQTHTCTKTSDVREFQEELCCCYVVHTLLYLTLLHL